MRGTNFIMDLRYSLFLFLSSVVAPIPRNRGKLVFFKNEEINA
jgi:hypothetical protein